MANYAIGDIHGCFEALKKLLAKIAFNPGKDTLWLTGDLVNRGAESLEVLRWAIKNASCVQTVLGNHDLHLLALSAGCRPLNKSQMLRTIFEANDGKHLLDWLRHQPLLLTVSQYIVVHAGLLPSWRIADAIEFTSEITTELQSPSYQHFFSQLYGYPNPTQQDNISRWRKTIDVTTRMRCLTHEGKLDFSYQGTIDDMPSRLMPWFSVPTVRPIEHIVIFGHWSALEPFVADQAIATDGGCVWGKKLVAVCLEDKVMHSVSCLPSTTC